MTLPGASILAVPSARGTLVVTGADRKSWLNGLVTCDLAPLRVGEAVYGLATSKVGRILADVVVLVDEDRLFVAVPEGKAGALAEALDAFLVMEDAELAVDAGERAWIFLHGAGAAELARGVAPALDGRAAAVELTGLGDAALLVPSSRLDEARAALSAAGARVVEDAAWDAARIELGVPRFGVDFDEKTYPQEASLERRAVSFKKGCYLGQEVVCRLEMRGHVHRKLVRLALEGEEVPARATPVESDAGEAVGTITSAALGPAAGRAVALAMVKYALAEPGTSLRVAGRAAVVQAPGG